MTAIHQFIIICLHDHKGGVVNIGKPYACNNFKLLFPSGMTLYHMHTQETPIQAISKMATNFFVNFSLTFLAYLVLFELFFGSNFYNFTT